MTEAEQIKRLVSAARTMISMQVGLAVGAVRLAGILGELGECYETRHGVVAEFMAAIPSDVPVGTARLYCTPQVLLERDAVLAAVEARFRRRLLQECMDMVRLYRPLKPEHLAGPWPALSPDAVPGAVLRC